MARAAATAASVDDLLGALGAALLEAPGADEAHVQLISQDARVGRGCVVRADGTVERYVQGLDGRPSGVAAVVASGEPLASTDARADALLRQDHVERWDIASVLLLPVRVRDDVHAVALVVSRLPRAFSAGEIEVGMTLADVCAAGLARIELAGQAERSAALARAAQALTASLDADEILSALCREADLALGADMCGVYLGDARDGGIAVAGHQCPPEWLGFHMAPGEGVAGQVLVTGRSVVCNDYQAQTRVPDETSLRILETAASVPMRWDGELKGALSVGFRTMRRITPEDLLTLEGFADLAVLACQNAEAYRRARIAARTDTLTGLLNHGAMQDRIAEEISRARRDGRALSLVLIDLDNFKAINDRAGHAIGDRFLRNVAGALVRAVRPHDKLARYGGDEFVLVLPGADAAAAAPVAERARRLVADLARAGDHGTAVGCSVGVATWHEPLSASDLLELADRAMLDAKRDGKGRVAIAAQRPDLRAAHPAPPSAEASPAGHVMREFWNLVAAASDPRDALSELPSFARGVIGLEEAALYACPEGNEAGALRRFAGAGGGDDERDGRQRAFAASELELPESAWAALTGGAVRRGGLRALLDALGASAGPSTAAAPGGSCAAIALARPGARLGVLLLRAPDEEFPADRLDLAERLAAQAVTVCVGSSGDEGSIAAVTALAAAIDARDDDTHRHSEEVVALATAVASRLGLRSAEVEDVRRGALLHDVGKVAIPNEILYKPGPLDAAEWRVMRKHPVIGERILRRTPQLAAIAPMVRHEHERYDGGGYPDGLAGEQIPIGSRIVLACDAYSAMTTKRPYREPMLAADAVAELRSGAGTQFDPRVAATLVGILEEDATQGVLMSVAE